MSIKSRRAVEIAGPEKHTEVNTTFRRNEDGTFTKIITMPIRDWKTNQVSKGRIKPIEEGPFVITPNSDEADATQTYQDIDGTAKFIYFKYLETDDI